MFNIGDEDKEKLKDNMDEIKNLINKEGEEPQTQQGNSQFRQVSEQQQKDNKPTEANLDQKNELEEELESSLQDLDQKDQVQSKENQFSPQNNDETFNQETFDDEIDPNNQQEPSRANIEEEKTQSQGSQSRRTQNNFNNNDSPDFSGNSLFLRVERFRNIEGLVNQMRNLTSQIDQQIGDLERTNEEDKEIKEETHKILSEFSSRRQEMEDSLMKNN